MSQGSGAEERAILSPLRYPGGKRRLLPYVAAALEVNGLDPDLFVEPFAGGASISLELLATGRVKRIGLAESDPYVSSFWQTVFFDTDWLCERVRNIEVSLTNWERIKRTSFATVRNQAIACLFLNRTSFNGTMHPRAGPIGGKRQTGPYKIDCRFPRERLVKRIQECGALADRVEFVRHASAFDVISAMPREYRGSSIFYYLDPPFWSKSTRLYRHSFTNADHDTLAAALRRLRRPYLLSYDPSPEVERLYRQHRRTRIERVELLYMATQRTAEHELVITNLDNVPKDTRLWRSKAEWVQLRRQSNSLKLPPDTNFNGHGPKGDGEPAAGLGGR